MKEGRGLFVADQCEGLKKVVPFMQCEHLVRQRGILGIVRNVLFDSAFHDAVIMETDLLNLLLAPLLVDGEFDDEVSLCLCTRVIC